MWRRHLRQRARLPVRLWLRGSLRRQLLILLVPALALMMAADTWFTYGTLRDAANTAYDRSLYGSVRTIDNAIGMAGESVQLTLPDAAMEMFETAAQTHVFYRVSMERTGSVETVTGYDDLPLPKGTLANNVPRFYDAVYHGDPVRIAAMARPIYRPDANMRVIIQVAETAEPRAALIGNVWRSALLRDIALSCCRPLSSSAASPTCSSRCNGYATTYAPARPRISRRWRSTWCPWKCARSSMP